MKFCILQKKKNGMEKLKSTAIPLGVFSGTEYKPVHKKTTKKMILWFYIQMD